VPKGSHLRIKFVRTHFFQVHRYLGLAMFHGGDYEECRLLRYENPVSTSQEALYVSAADCHSHTPAQKNKVLPQKHKHGQSAEYNSGTRKRKTTKYSSFLQ
jgi:hypothetical protein